MLSDIGERRLGSQYQNNLKVIHHSYSNNNCIRIIRLAIKEDTRLGELK